MLLPISVETKGVLWVVFFGLAKTAQYGGITILGVEGYRRVKAYFKPNLNGRFESKRGNKDKKDDDEQ